MEKEFNQMEYINEYNKKTYKNYSFRIRKENKEIIEWLDKQKNITGYLVELIEKDMKK